VVRRLVIVVQQEQGALRNTGLELTLHSDWQPNLQLAKVGKPAETIDEATGCLVFELSLVGLEGYCTASC
jgi:hypothetical protein